MIKTKRVTIYPTSNEEMESLISNQTIPDLKKAYQEMLDGCRKPPDKREWYAIPQHLNPNQPKRAVFRQLSAHCRP